MSSRAPLGCAGIEDSHHQCTDDKSGDAITLIWTKLSEDVKM